MAIDFGRRRCGVAVTDPMRIVASALQTVATPQIIPFVKDYMARETVDAIIVGSPTDLRGNPSESMRYITPVLNRMRKELPGVEVVMHDERFTSTLAHRAMIDSGMKRSQRRDKALADRMAATIILNDFLQSRQYAQMNKK